MTGNGSPRRRVVSGRGPVRRLVEDGAVVVQLEGTASTREP
jgi:hypothetical protein